MRVYSHIAECSLSSAKIIQMSAMRIYSHIAECSLSSAKIMQMSAMRIYSHIAECSLSSAKIRHFLDVRMITLLNNVSNLLPPASHLLLFLKNLYKYPLKTHCIFFKIFFACKYRKIRHFTIFRLNSLIIRDLS